MKYDEFSTYHWEETPDGVLVGGDHIVTSVHGRSSCHEDAIGLFRLMLAAPKTHVGIAMPRLSLMILIAEEVLGLGWWFTIVHHTKLAAHTDLLNKQVSSFLRAGILLGHFICWLASSGVVRAKQALREAVLCIYILGIRKL